MSKHWAGFLVGVVLVALVVVVVEEERFFGGLVVVAVVEERVLGELVVGVGVGGGRGGRSRGVDRMRFLSGGTVLGSQSFCCCVCSSFSPALFV